ncbi:addiction module antidote protein [Kumtagia ephedrae]|jgi:probable addiction module antidote protein|uniref:Putative addiction module antidote protein n=1 Tax=Kumtagia ephedrae TaxID=2116701 RepID=A0A2P7S215_9HYPH|nr:addiction module antidote protein [Mesorhizobium ephedrae]PSJ56502.1 putative addiction module antidote protein [Mesorhizobium ephedrae]
METTRFDAAEYLDTPELQAAYITAALETGDLAEVRDAIGLVARARGMADIAAAAKLNPKSLYKALGDSGNPEFATVLSVLNALGLTLSATPTDKSQRARRKRASPQKSAA